jgi:uncharacterized protein HemX
MASYEGRRDVGDRLRSLTRALVAVAVLAVAALGVGVWALLEDDEDDRRPRAGAVRALEDRLDELEAEVQRAPSRVEVSIRDEQRSLDDRVEALEHSTSDAVEDVRQDLEELRQRVDELEREVERPTAPER